MLSGLRNYLKGISYRSNKLIKVVRKRILPFLVNPEKNFKEIGLLYLY
jgi:hypothetical protein